MTKFKKGFIKSVEEELVRDVLTNSSELTEDRLEAFYQIAEEERESRRKQTVTLRLTPQAVKKARSLGKGYTAVLSRIIENALDDPETLRKNL